MKAVDDFSNNENRATLLHGDFWANNIIFTDKPNLIDFSRMCQGEPGIDVGWLYASLVWQSVSINSIYFLNLAEIFLEKYIDLSKDGEIEKFAVSSIGFIGLIAGIEKFSPNVPLFSRKKFIEWIFISIKNRKLLRKEIFNLIK
jgi:thiamine kinase-like enzyme